MSWRLLWVWLALAVGCSGVAAREVLTLGVLAIRPSAPTSLRWQPLQGYLNSAVPEYEFVVKALDLAELRQAVRLAQVDLVITDPAEYVRMAHVNGLAAPLATLVGSHEGNAVRVLGGAIVAQAARPDIVALADLAGKTVAVVSRDMFAGYQVQAHALKGAGVTPGAVLEVGPAQDDALMAVLKGRADLAFVQAGLLEAMVNEGQVAPNTLKIINAQPFAGYPFAASTALYPQWPVLALQHVRDVTAARVAGALLSMPRQGALAKAIGIEGFSVPADYESVRALMRTMRMAPFDAESRVTLIDVWHDHQPLVVVGALSILFVAVLALRSTLTYGKNSLQDTAGLPESEVLAKQFHLWLGQAQFGRQVMDNGAQLVLRATLQHTRDRLLALDGLAIGGVNTVRGYRENQLVRDKGAFLNVEFEYPLLREAADGLSLTLIPFYDHGRAQNVGEEAVTLSSWGLGGRLRWQRFNLDLVLAQRLSHPASVSGNGSTLQDHGVHLQLAYKF